MGKTIQLRKMYVISAALLAGVALVTWSPLRHAFAEATDVGADNAARMLNEGKQTFRFDTFGDEAFWGDALKLHQAIAGSRFGGVGGGVSPKTALAVGLKIDVDAVPSDLAAQLKAGAVNLDDPASTLALLKANAVVGATGFLARHSNDLK